MMSTSTAPRAGHGADPLAARPLLARFCAVVEHFCALVLAADVAVVFFSVIMRYFLHRPVDWAEDIAGCLMTTLVFLGGSTVLARRQHVGIEVFRAMLPESWREPAMQLGGWAVAGTAGALAYSSWFLLLDSFSITTPIGTPQWVLTLPVFVGAVFMTMTGLVNAASGATRHTWATLAAAVLLCLGVCAWNYFFDDSGWGIPPWLLLALAFFGSLIAGVPIAFVLALSALVYFLADPSLPMEIYSQQVLAGMDSFVLLAIPFFVLAGLIMESNGMSTRLIELLVRLFGRVRGSMNLISILATAFFSGVSGSKLADIAAVGSIIVPAVRRARQDPNETAAVLACSAVMAETIPPCVNMIILGFVANISIGGLFLAGLVPAVVLATGMAVMAIYSGKKIDPHLALPVRRPWPQLLGGAFVALVMVGMIGKGVTSGVATSTEVSSFAVVYALVVGSLAFRELTLRSVVAIFVRAAAMASSILFIIAAASSVAFALTVLQLPTLLSNSMTHLAHSYGSTAFILVSALLTIVFGAILEGAPALIIFGPLLTPIAQQVGVNPLHFGTVIVISMGLGLFSPPFGLGLFATCAMTDTRVEHVTRPMLKYLLLLAAMLVVLIFVPAISLWVPRLMNMA